MELIVSTDGLFTLLPIAAWYICGLEPRAGRGRNLQSPARLIEGKAVETVPPEETSAGARQRQSISLNFRPPRRWRRPSWGQSAACEDERLARSPQSPGRPVPPCAPPVMVGPNQGPSHYVCPQPAPPPLRLCWVSAKITKRPLAV